MPSGFLILAGIGAQDQYLNSRDYDENGNLMGEPNICYFKAVYRKYANFSVENISQFFTGNIDFGKKVYCQIDRIGEMMNQIYLRVKLPSLKEYSYTDVDGNLINYYWINSVGHAMIKYVEVEIGDVVVDRQYGLWMEIWSELSVDASKRVAFNSLIGKSDTPVNLNNDEALNLYVPLQFWFCKNIGLSLPLVALQSAQVRINILFRPVEELIISSDGNPMNQNDLKNIHITNACLEVDYIYLDEEEKFLFSSQPHQYLIEQVQVTAQSISSGPYDPDTTPEESKHKCLQRTIDLDFYNPVKEVVWVIQNSSVLSIYPYGGNEWFNFSSQSYKNGDINGSDTMVNGQFLLEGNPIVEMKDNIYYRQILPMKYHTSVPNNYIYVYPFALRPEAWQPSGVCNMSAFSSKQLYLNISPELVDPIITIYALSYNILNVFDGLAGVEYSC
jgi:hypothetical protein